jgi:hypothetical protein
VCTFSWISEFSESNKEIKLFATSEVKKEEQILSVIRVKGEERSIRERKEAMRHREDTDERIIG